ncbi:MAG: hypothetical protein KHY88_00220 [Erysipelotrichaceae bacterium]|nr:hypothetical protein [Erysipelotrichaceae bacterium]
MKVKLNMVESVQLNANASIDANVVETYNASISTESPNNLQYTSYISNQELYKQNRSDLASTRKEFEDRMYEIQNEMLSKGEK